MKKIIEIHEKNRNPIVRKINARPRTMARILQRAGSSLVPEINLLDRINKLESYLEDKFIVWSN